MGFVNAKISKRRTLNCLPKEIIEEVLGRVSASSAVDLLSCRLSCNALYEISKEKYVLQQASIDTIVSRSWTTGMDSFVARCLKSNNPEALLHLGWKQYFTYMKLEEGLKNLERSVKLGNKMAAYMLGLIFLCSGEEESMAKGTELLINTMRMIGGNGIVECREKLCFYRTLWWFENKLIGKTMPKISCDQHIVNSGWGGYYDGEFEDSVVCETCKCAREIGFFKAML